MGAPRRELFSQEHAASIKKEQEPLLVDSEDDGLGVKTPARVARREIPLRAVKEAAALGKRKAEWWCSRPSDSSQQQLEQNVLDSQSEGKGRTSPPTHPIIALPSQDGLSSAAGLSSHLQRSDSAPAVFPVIQQPQLQSY